MHLPYVQRLRDRVEHQRRVVDRREVDEDDTVLEGSCQLCRYRLCQPCLADAAGAGQRQQTDVVTQQ